ncbi:TetR/AcrR family transcriptional regulator [Neorhizobium alkalisoli]|uniref:TetR family transcriptional regulator n=1 Tax=Neorhizobium alkalisoli TaxID=528178 RepID=A0A561R1U1_9HYPH|nr:TetR/AcrR family transcriptional regulator [Neorhizobium alkalisoli]TWF56572.1 TetR family transcriptional regulator [Neorhizobium alkalisoli]
MKNSLSDTLLEPETWPAPQNKRQAILNAAADIFAEEGFAGASIDAIAARAGVSRQTIYNQLGDKDNLFKVVVSDITDRSSAGFFKVLDTFPVTPKNLEAELAEFSANLLRKAICDPNGRWLRKLVETEGDRFPELFETWKEYGPGKKYPAIAARLAQLALGGYLDLDDPALAARQYMALLATDLKINQQTGRPMPESEIDQMAADATKTFIRAFGRR